MWAAPAEKWSWKRKWRRNCSKGRLAPEFVYCGMRWRASMCTIFHMGNMTNALFCPSFFCMSTAHWAADFGDNPAKLARCADPSRTSLPRMPLPSRGHFSSSFEFKGISRKGEEWARKGFSKYESHTKFVFTNAVLQKAMKSNGKRHLGLLSAFRSVETLWAAFGGY